MNVDKFNLVDSDARAITYGNVIENVAKVMGVVVKKVVRYLAGGAESGVKLFVVSQVFGQFMLSYGEDIVNQLPIESKVYKKVILEMVYGLGSMTENHIMKALKYGWNTVFNGAAYAYDEFIKKNKAFLLYYAFKNPLPTLAMGGVLTAQRYAPDMVQKMITSFFERQIDMLK